MKAYDTIWIVGDEFVSKSGVQHFINSKVDNIKNGHMLHNFDVKLYVSGKFSSNNRSALSRIRNCVVKAINENYLLPKIIVMVVDCDILSDVQFDHYGISVLLGMINEWLCSEIHKVIWAYKDKLPAKAVKDNYPHILWIEPPLHKNFRNNDKCKKFVSSLDGVIKKLYSSDMTIFQMRKIWDYEDSILFLANQQRFTVEGHTRYWQAIDHLVKLWDTFLSKKKKPQKVQNGAAAVTVQKSTVNSGGGDSTDLQKIDDHMIGEQTQKTEVDAQERSRPPLSGRGRNRFTDHFHWHRHLPHFDPFKF